jgi:hypothetical protein
VVSGIRYGQAGLGKTITVSAPMGDIRFRTFNGACAARFVSAVESAVFRARFEGVRKNAYDDTAALAAQQTKHKEVEL